MDDAVGWFGALGMCLATVISDTTWKSIAWATLHGIFGWMYVLYFAIMY